jgi:hypothetical protein
MHNFLNPHWARAERGCVEDQPPHYRMGDALRLVWDDTTALRLKAIINQPFAGRSLEFIWSLVFGIWWLSRHV